MLPKRNEEKMGPANLLHASAKYSKYNEKFDLNKRNRENQLEQSNLTTTNQQMMHVKNTNI